MFCEVSRGNARRAHRWLGGALLALAVSFTATGAQAAMVSFQLSVEFSGATAPDAVGPWLSVTLDDGGTPGSVDLTLSEMNLTDPEFVFGWYLNLDPTMNPNDLDFSAPGKTGAFSDPTIATGVNAFQADGDGMFDIQVGFSSGGGPGARFGVGDAVHYTITGIPTLTALSFDFQSEQGGGNGSFASAAHIGATGSNDEDSGWVGTPEPTSVCLLAFGSLALMRRRR